MITRFVFVAALLAVAPAAAGEPTLVKAWVIDGFSSPEGVAEAPDGALFISNVSGEDAAKDGVGWISRISNTGVVLDPRFIDGLNAPKGMAVHDGKLYVADIDLVRIFDATTGAPLDSAEVGGAKFLNDATVWQGDVFVSDSDTGRIWRLTGAGFEVWREGEELSGVNGLLGSGDNLFVSTMTSGSLFEATAKGGWRKIAGGMIDADGIGVIAAASGGGHLVSSWPGKIYRVSASGDLKTLLDTSAAPILQNDLTIVGDLVIVPNWEPGTVTAWRLSR